MNIAFYRKCALLVKSVNNFPPEMEEKNILKELKSKGGWLAELTPKKLNLFCQHYFWIKYNDKLDLAKITHEALLKLLKLKDNIKTKIIEIFQEREEEILSVPVLNKLKNIAVLELSRLGTVAKLATEMDGKQGLITCKHLAKVADAISKQNEDTQEILLTLASELSEVVAIEDVESVKEFSNKVLAAEEMLANQIDVEIVKESLQSETAEYGSDCLRSLAKFNSLLIQTKAEGEEILSSSNALTGSIKAEIEQRLNTLGHVQLNLNFNLSGV